jgi:hypothetical protein
MSLMTYHGSSTEDEGGMKERMMIVEGMRKGNCVLVLAGKMSGSDD